MINLFILLALIGFIILNIIITILLSIYTIENIVNSIYYSNPDYSDELKNARKYLIALMVTGGIILYSLLFILLVWLFSGGLKPSTFKLLFGKDSSQGVFYSFLIFFIFIFLTLIVMDILSFMSYFNMNDIDDNTDDPISNAQLYTIISMVLTTISIILIIIVMILYYAYLHKDKIKKLYNDTKNKYNNKNQQDIEMKDMSSLNNTPKPNTSISSK